jgi:hypothetical protein
LTDDNELMNVTHAYADSEDNLSNLDFRPFRKEIKERMQIDYFP